jgi:RNA polymerase sporulation-specific sigma factor
MYQYNDYELLYLIRENCEVALDIMFSKYVPLIKSRIRSFHIKEWNKEDFFQEGLISLYKAITTYREDKNKTFNKYFDLLLQRRYIQILRKESNNFYNVDLIGAGDYLYEANECFDDNLTYVVNQCYFSKFEASVFENLKMGAKAREIALILGCKPKQVYDATDRIKKKIKGVKNSLDI